MASKAARFAARAETTRDNLASAVVAPAGIQTTSGSERLAAARAQEEAERSASLPTVEESRTLAHLSVAPSRVEAQPPEVSEPDGTSPAPEGANEPVQTRRKRQPATSPSGSAWDPSTLVTPQPVVKPKPKTARVTYTAPPGLSEMLRDLDVRSARAHLRTVHRDALVTEAAKRVVADPKGAAATFAAYGWIKGEGQLQPRLLVDLATEVKDALANLDPAILDVGPVVGVMTLQVAREFDAWLRGREADL